jgi:hypothetical protein
MHDWREREGKQIMIRDLLDLLFGIRINQTKSSRHGKVLTISLKERGGRRFVTVTMKGGGDIQFYVFDKASFAAWPDEVRQLKDILAPWEPRLT